MGIINPYLNFKGTTEEAFNFYKSVFGGEFITLQRFGDSPGCDGMPPADKEKIMHIALPIGNNVLMATDVVEGQPFPFIEGNNISLSINATSEADADQKFNGLSAGGKVIMPMEKAFWGAYFGMFTDKFGINWMVNFDYEQK